MQPKAVKVNHHLEHPQKQNNNDNPSIKTATIIQQQYPKENKYPPPPNKPITIQQQPANNVWRITKHPLINLKNGISHNNYEMQNINKHSTFSPNLVLST